MKNFFKKITQLFSKTTKLKPVNEDLFTFINNNKVKF